VPEIDETEEQSEAVLALSEQKKKINSIEV
jgi:hypothetical protein